MEESKTSNDTTLNSRTGFSEDGVMPTTAYSGGTSDTVKSAAMSVADFLRIPQQVVKGTWSSLDTPGSQLLLNGQNYLSTDDLLVSNPLWKSKLEGYSLIRSTMVVRVQVNANPFMAGKLYMHFLPMASRHELGFTYTHNHNLATISSQHGLDIDARDTGAEMRIPYNTPYNWYSLWKSSTRAHSDVCERGRIFLTVQAALRSLDIVDCGFSIWVHWEDVELAGPIVPQAGGLVKSVTDKEESAMHDRTISSALSTGAKVAGALSSIPSLRPLMAPTEWALETAAGVAASFGYSKPKLSEPFGLMINQPFRYTACGDGESTAIPLGLKHNAGTALASEGLDGDQDEMSWNYLKKVPVIMRTFSWDTSMTPGTSLLSMDLSPAHFHVSDTMTSAATGGSRTVVTGDAIATFSQFFKNWRGGRELHFRFAKTDFHTGRIEIVYCPGTHSTPPSFNTSAYVLREVVDLSITNSVKVTLPYIQPSDYLNIDQSLGSVHVFVSTSLRAAPSVDSTIDCMVWSCAADDFEFAVPAGANQLYVPVSAEGSDDVSMHGGVVETDLGVIGDSRESDESLMHPSRAVGENFNSLRSLLLAPTRLYPQTKLPTGSILGFTPWFTSVARIASGGGYESNGQLGGDMYSALSGMFAFAKGGMRLLLHMDGASLVAYQDPYASGSSVVWAPNHSIADSAELPYYSRADGPRGVAMGFGDSLQVEIPYYNHVRKHVMPFEALAGINDYTVPSTSVIFTDLKGGDLATSQVYRSIADDHQLSGFCGFVPLGSKTLSTFRHSTLELRRFLDPVELDYYDDVI